jgi:nucleoside-diphosphate-sugar epimerase
LKAAGIRPLISDITKLDELRKLPREFDWVVNCVAAGGNAESYRQIYLEGNRNLVSWLADSSPKKFIYTSSTSVYGQNDGSVVTEKSPVEPEADTAKVLVEAEKMLLTEGGSRGRSPHPKFPAVVLRVAGVYGPGRGHWFKQFLKGEAHIEGNGSRWLNMIHRDDVAGCIIAALENGRAGEIYNAVDDEPVTQLTFFEGLAAELKRPMPPTIAAEAEIRRKRGVTNKRVSNAKLRTELKYEFHFPNFRKGYGAEISRLKRAGELRATPNAQ